jgi:S1-C subfamily serine protease
MRPLLLCLFLLLKPFPATGAEGIALYDQLRNSIVTVKGKTPSLDRDGRIRTDETSGAGIILDSTGIVATNTHVIYGGKFIEVTLDSGETLNARILYIAPQDDVSLIKIDPPFPLAVVNWADSNLVQLGDDVITIGHSELLRATLSGGHIRSIGVHKDDPARTPEFFLLDINHYPGDSGGPVFDRQGRFLGLMNAKRMTENRACLVIPSNKIHFAYLTVANGDQNR